MKRKYVSKITKNFLDEFNQEFYEQTSDKYLIKRKKGSTNNLLKFVN